jgi:hypothetical protein
MKSVVNAAMLGFAARATGLQQNPAWDYVPENLLEVRADPQQRLVCLQQRLVCFVRMASRHDNAWLRMSLGYTM